MRGLPRSLLLLYALLIGFAPCKLPAQEPNQSTKAPERRREEALAWFRKGEALIGTAQENSDEQLELFRKAAAIEPNFWEARFNAGLILAHQKKWDAAGSELRRLVTDRPTHEGAWFMLGIVSQQTGRWSEAESNFRVCLKINSNHLEARKALAVTLIRLKRNAEALGELQAVLAREPADQESLFNSGLIRLEQRDFPAASQLLQELLRLYPQATDARYLLAQALSGAGKKEEAVEELKRAIDGGEDSAEAYSLLGDLMNELSREEESRIAYEKAIEAGSEDAEVFCSLGTLYARSGRHQDAIGVLQKAVQKKPDFGLAYLYLGRACDKMNRVEEAIESYQKGIALGAQDVHSCLRLVFLLSVRKDKERALDFLERAVQMAPQEVRTLIREELKNIRSDLDSIRYSERFHRLIFGESAKPK